MSMASAATDSYTEPCGVGHHLEPCWLSEGHAAAGATSISVACIATWGHGDIMVPAENHVWVFDPTTAGIWVNVPGLRCRSGEVQMPSD